MKTFLLTNDERTRYSRHLLLPEIGLIGQERLTSSKVLVIGAGGLGSPAALYLAAAGVGTIGIVDNDRVELSNLQRQILHSTDDVGERKVQSASKRLQQLNPHIAVESYPVYLDAKNAVDILQKYDVIIDGTDNFATRYLVNDASALLKKPLVYGSVFRFTGQISVFDAAKGGCYRCLYPTPPPPHLVPNCAEGGVLGVLPGIIGTMQATEALKIVLGIGETLHRRLLLFDALQMNVSTINYPHNPHCALCGTHPTIHELQDYETWCNPPTLTNNNATADLHPEEVAAMLEDIVFVDVREEQERAIRMIKGTRHIPLGQVEQHIEELAALTKPLVIHCHSGKRSAAALEILSRYNISAQHLAGGIIAWEKVFSTTIAEQQETIESSTNFTVF